MQICTTSYQWLEKDEGWVGGGDGQEEGQGIEESMTGRHGKTARMEMVICFHKVDDLEGDDN